LKNVLNRTIPMHVYRYFPADSVFSSVFLLRFCTSYAEQPLNWVFVRFLCWQLRSRGCLINTVFLDPAQVAGCLNSSSSGLFAAACCSGAVSACLSSALSSAGFMSGFVWRCLCLYGRAHMVFFMIFKI